MCGGARCCEIQILPVAAAEVITAKLFCSRDPEFVFYDQLKQTMNAYRFVLMRNVTQHH